MSTKVKMTGSQYKELASHLFPGDGKEAVAVGLCGRRQGAESQTLLVRELVLIPHSICIRTADRITWPPSFLASALSKADEDGLGIVKFHSHPNNFPDFSEVDDQSDRLVFESIYGWINGDGPHASSVMLQNGRLFARTVSGNGRFETVDSVSVIGDDIVIYSPEGRGQVPGFALRHAQIFGEGTTLLLGQLQVGVVGCSGTGSPIVEQLARLGIGKLVLVDPDRVEVKNLNRIVGATMQDATSNRLKTDVLKRSVEAMGLGTEVIVESSDLQAPNAILALAECDVVFGCMDRLLGRNVLNRLSRFYLIPCIDVGVGLEGAEDGDIDQIDGAVHFLRPDGSDLIQRGVISPEALAAESLLLTNPEEYAEQVKNKYIKGVRVERPAVVTINHFYSSIAVLELLARLQCFRLDKNVAFATQHVSLMDAHWVKEPDFEMNPANAWQVGRGDMLPFLGLPQMGEIGFLNK